MSFAFFENKPYYLKEHPNLNELLQSNSELIKNSYVILQNVFQNIHLHEKIIFLCDNNGYILDMLGNANTMQYFFQAGIKLGTSLAYESIGTSAVECVLQTRRVSVLDSSQHSLASVQEWTCVASPIYVANEFVGIVSLAMKIQERMGHCTTVLRLITDYISTLLEKSTLAENEKIIFFGSLILNDKLNLTKREIEILYLLQSNFSPDNLASKINVSPYTIRTHLKNIYAKLEVENINECLQKIKQIISN